jgi:hypothetical protein
MRPAPVTPLLLAALFACGLRPASADAADAPRHVVVAGAARDTLEGSWAEVLPVAISELEKNEWVIQRMDSASATRRLVTRWKPLKHRLARLFLGDVLARCVIDLEPVEGGRTLVTMQGGLASNEDLEGNPGFPAAQATYRRAAEKWLTGVRTELAARAPAAR